MRPARDRRRDDEWQQSRRREAEGRQSYGDPYDARDDLDEPAYRSSARTTTPQDNPANSESLHCKVAHRCGGCEWLRMPYVMQLERKQDMIEELFDSYKCPVDTIVGMQNPVHYRNKVQLPFAPSRGEDGRGNGIRWGIFERGTHHIVGCDSCLVEDKRARPVIAHLADIMSHYRIAPYDERTDGGVIRYGLVRTALHTKQMMLTIVSNARRLPNESGVVHDLLDKFPGLTSIVLNINQEHTNTILGREERVLHGPGYIEDTICGCRFRISSSSFYQTNPIQAEVLYDLAIQMADLKADDYFGDAYCGTGTIGIVAAKMSGARLLGVEKNPDAVDDARVNAELNGLEDAEFLVGDAGSMFSRMARAGEKLDVVFLDPPRAGSSQAFLANLCRLSPRKVVYISCNPVSQRHDVYALVKNGYRVRRIQPVDMFPHTDHVENIILLERPNDGQRFKGGRPVGKSQRRTDDRSRDEW